MQRNHFLSVIFILLTSFFQTVDAQTNLFVGTWVDASGSSTLTMNKDFSFSAKSSAAESYGNYGWKDNVLNFFNKQGQQIMYYTVNGINESKMSLTDPNGYKITYLKRNQQATKPQRPSTQNTTSSMQIPWEVGQFDNVLASSQGMDLKRSDVQKGIALLEFIVAKHIKASEVTELEKASVRDFKKNPKGFLTEINSIGEAMKRAYTISDVAKLGAARQELFASLYLATLNTPVAQQPKLVQVMNRYVKVLTYDAQNKLVLTEKDIQGMINYTEFQSQLTGNGQKMSYTERATLKQQMVVLFSQMTLEKKQYLCSASLIWEVMEWNWNKMNTTQKQQFSAQYQQQVPQQQTVNYTNGGANTGFDQETQNLLDYYERLYPTSAASNNTPNKATWDMMQRMQLENHVTSMNIIENIGGSGDYWEVAPSVW